MSERTIWIVRLVGIVLFLVLMYLLMSLYTQLVKMNEGGGAEKQTTVSSCRSLDSPLL